MKNIDIKVMVADKVIAMADTILDKASKGERGNVRLPWNVTRSGWPCNWNGIPYRGANVIILSMAAMASGYDSNVWLTYKKVNELGGTVRKGEHSTYILFWKTNKYTDRDADTGEETTRTIPILRYYKVFNLDQTEGVRLPKKVATLIETNERSDLESVDEAEAILATYLARDDAPTFREGGDRAFYSPSLDGICIPRRETYDAIERFYATAYHEVAHSTGHKSRLNRDGNMEPHFGDALYGAEELVAQMSAGMLCGIAGIDNEDTEEFDIEYLTNWTAAIKANKAMLVDAAGKAQRAIDYILGTEWDTADA